MNTFFGFSRNLVGLLAVLAAIALVVLAGLLWVIAGATGTLLAAPAAGPVPVVALLVTIVVLLLAVFVLLLLLLRCACRSDDHKRVPPELTTVLPSVLPLLTTLPNVLRDMAIALKKTGDAVDWIRGNVHDAGAVLDTAATTASTFTITVPTVLGHETTVNNATVWVFDGIDLHRQYSPLTGLQTHLSSTASHLKGHSEPGGDLAQVRATLRQTAAALGTMANALGAAPPAGPEITQP